MAEKRPSLKSPLFRGSFVHLAKARVSENDDGTTKEQYEICMPLPKDEPATIAFLKKLRALLRASSAEKHGGEGLEENRLKHYPIKDGDDQDLEQFHGYWMITAKSNFKPDAIDINGDTLLTTDELYSGAWYKVQVSAWAWVNKKGGKGVSVNLEAVIKMKDDKRIGGGVQAKSAFADDIGTGEDKDDTNDDPAPVTKKRSLLG